MRMSMKDEEMTLALRNSRPRYLGWPSHYLLRMQLVTDCSLKRRSLDLSREPSVEVVTLKDVGIPTKLGILFKLILTLELIKPSIVM